MAGAQDPNRVFGHPESICLFLIESQFYEFSLRALRLSHAHVDDYLSGDFR